MGVVNSHVVCTASGDSISSLSGPLRQAVGGDAGGIRGSPGISLSSVGMEMTNVVSLVPTQSLK